MSKRPITVALANGDLPTAAAAFRGGFSAGMLAWPLAPGEAVAEFCPETGISIFLRSAFSNLSRMSLFSFRKLRAFSRPWPMRSPP